MSRLVPRLPPEALISSTLTLRPRSAARTPLARWLQDETNPGRAILDSLYTNCMVADLELNIIYVNRQARTTLARIEPALLSEFKVSVADLLGGSIHRFHRDPGRIEKILADPKEMPRIAVFSFGGTRLRTHINTVTDSAGELIGYVVVWDDITERDATASTLYRAVSDSVGRIDQVGEDIRGSSVANSEHAQTVASASEQLRASVQEIARTSAAVAEQVKQAVEATRSGVETIRGLHEASNEIGSFLDLINRVADQTKLLALNANIEAARAGEAGRGFAVVAEEVKQLAGTTSESITDIESRVQAIQSAAAEGTSALETIDGLVEQISESQASVGAALEEQTSVTSEVSASIGEIVSGAQATVELADAVTEAANAVRKAASQLHTIA